MHKQYLHERTIKKEAAKKYLWLAVTVGIGLILIIAKFALSDAFRTVVSDLPSSEDAYAVARDYIKPTLKTTDAHFPNSDYEFGKKADSVYVIRSVAITKDLAGEDQKTNFEVTLLYKGGPRRDKKSWELISIKED